MISNTSRIGLAVFLTLSCLAAEAARNTPTDAEVKKLQQQCEAKRQVKLEPIRAQKTQTCIEQKLRTEDHCKRYYTTYGNTSAGPGRSMQQGYFYDLPECQSWIEAREALRVSRSRN